MHADQTMDNEGIKSANATSDGILKDSEHSGESIASSSAVEVDSKKVDFKPEPIVTRSKLKTSNNNIGNNTATDKIEQQQTSTTSKIESESETATEHEEFTSDEGEGGNHPPLRMKIIVTSPSAVKEKVIPQQIVSETITQTSYFGEAPPDSLGSGNVKQSAVTDSSVVEPSSEDLIRQHLNKMPGINFKCSSNFLTV